MFDGAPYYAENLVYPRATWFSDSAYARHGHATSHHPVAAREPQVGACTTASRSALARGSTTSTRCDGPGPPGVTATTK